MIDPAWLQLMARYNRWQNDNLYAAASTLSDQARRADRGAFFGSIHATLNHILWGDQLWLSRFTDHAAPPVAAIPGSTGLHESWEALCDDRERTDAFITDWAGAVAPADIEGDLSWHSGALGRDMTAPRAVLFTHFFNHQAHHRGQVHAMLTAAGAKPGDTDLPFMPDL